MDEILKKIEEWIAGIVKNVIKDLMPQIADGVRDRLDAFSGFVTQGQVEAQIEDALADFDIGEYRQEIETIIEDHAFANEYVRRSAVDRLIEDFLRDRVSVELEVRE